MKNKLLLLIVFLGTAVWSIAMVRSGLHYAYGIGFWGPNAHDGVWHLALSRNLFQTGLQMPIFAGYPIQNYHIGYDFLIALLNFLTQVPVSVIYFQVLPPLVAALVGLLTYKLVYSWTGSKASSLWSTFFVYFAGNFGFVVGAIKDHALSGESSFWAQSSGTTLINPPYALSLVFLLGGLNCLFEYFKSRKKSYVWLSILCFGLLAQIKVYASIISLGALFVVAFFMCWKKGDKVPLVIFTASLILAFLLMIPFNKGSYGLLVFKPFWFLETMFQFSDRINFPKYYEAMLAYKMSWNLVKGIPAYLVALGIFVVGNLGIRSCFLYVPFLWLKNFKKTGWFEKFIMASLLISLTIPMLFLQHGTAWNTIQFFYYFLFFVSIISGPALVKLLSKNPGLSGYVIATLVVFINLPTVASTLKHYVTPLPQSKLSNSESEALKFLGKQQKGVVLVQIFDSAWRVGDMAPIDLPKYDTTAYVSAYSGMPTFLADEVNLEITGYEYKERKAEVISFFADPNTQLGRSFLVNNNIRYIYFLKHVGSHGPDENYLGLSNIFDNSEVVVYRRNGI